MSRYSGWSAQQAKTAVAAVDVAPLRQLGQLLRQGQAAAQRFQTDTQTAAGTLAAGWKGEAAAAAYGTVTETAASVSTTETSAVAARSTLADYTTGLTRDIAAAASMPARPAPSLTDFKTYLMLTSVPTGALLAVQALQAESDRRALVAKVEAMDAAGSSLAQQISSTFSQSQQVADGVAEPPASLTAGGSGSGGAGGSGASAPRAAGAPSGAAGGGFVLGGAGGITGSQVGPVPSAGGVGTAVPGGPGGSTGLPPTSTPTGTPVPTATGGPTTATPSTVDPTGVTPTGSQPPPLPTATGAGAGASTGPVGTAAPAVIAGGAAVTGLVGGVGALASGSAGGLTGAPLGGALGGSGSAGGGTSASGGTSAGGRVAGVKPGLTSESPLSSQTQAGQSRPMTGGRTTGSSGSRMVQRTVGGSSGSSGSSSASSTSSSGEGRSATGSRSRVLGEKGPGRSGSRAVTPGGESTERSSMTRGQGGRGGRRRDDRRELNDRPDYLTESDEVWGDGRAVSRGVIGEVEEATDVAE